MEREEGEEGERGGEGGKEIREGRGVDKGGGVDRGRGENEEIRVHLCELTLLSTFHFGCAVGVLMSPHFARMPYYDSYLAVPTA